MEKKVENKMHRALLRLYSINSSGGLSLSPQGSPNLWSYNRKKLVTAIFLVYSGHLTSRGTTVVGRDQ